MLAELQNIFRTVFNNNALVISLSTSPNDFDLWDSLTHLELIAAIEEQFQIQFSFEEVIELKDAAAIINLILFKQKS
jgi:acyl carrier protein